jgi:GNAT superfamily N-acetyltransferase
LALPGVTVTVGTLVTRPWRAGDLDRLRSAEQLFSTRTLSRRFHSGTSSLPPSYLRSLLRPSLRQAAIHRGQVVGLAECVWPTGAAEWRNGAQRAEDADPPDLAIMIADDWQSHGVGKRLMIGLARRCIAAGVRRVQAETEAENVAAAALARSVTRPGVLPGCWEVGTSSMAAYRHLIFTYCG